MPINVTKEHFRWTNGRGHNQKPILYSQKQNKHGLGKKQNSSDQWWERAFDNQLKGLDVARAGGEVTVTQTARNVTVVGMEKLAGYNIRFVRGGVLQGGREVTGIAEVEEVEGVLVGSEEAGREREREIGRAREGEKEGKRETKEKKAERRQRKLLKRMVEREMAVLKREKK